MVTYRETNRELFDKMVIDVDTMGLKSQGYDRHGNALGFNGSLAIERNDGYGLVTYSGEFSPNDFKDELGFVLENHRPEQDPEERFWNDMATWNERFSYD